MVYSGVTAESTEVLLLLLCIFSLDLYLLTLSLNDKDTIMKKDNKVVIVETGYPPALFLNAERLQDGMALNDISQIVCICQIVFM